MRKTCVSHAKRNVILGEQQQISAMSDILEKKHSDWPKFLQWIPRKWTAFHNWGKPKLILGNQKEVRNGAPAPIGEPSSVQVSYYPDAPWWAKPIAWYVAYSGKKGADGKYRHYRIGGRWDDVDSYAQWPSIATRRYTGDDKQNTGVR